jgi:arabinan endo-1,5-alpha-L-arabinosidase
VRGAIGRSLVAVVALVAVAAIALLVPRVLAPAYENPVLRNDAPDPSVIRAADGAYYAYTTQSYHDAVFHNVPVLRSEDLITWELLGDAMPTRPDWTPPGVDRGDVWAPHAIRFGDRYHLYFSARRIEGKMAIGVATSESPGGPFVDAIGEPLVTGELAFEAIDPFVMEAPDGHKYIYWGSDGAPIRVQRLSADGLSLAGEPQPLLEPDGSSEYEGLVEGAWVWPHAGWWYLMYSGDACCGADAHYAVLVARSRSWLGPFERFDGNPILEANDRFNAPGHHAMVRDEAGRDWIVYHAMIRGDFTNYRYLFVDPVEWDGGWPVVNAGHGPSTEAADAPEV